MYAALRHKPAAKRHALRRVVVSADEKDLEVPLGQAHQKVVQQRHSLSGGYGLVVDIPGNHHAIRLLPVNDLQNFSQNILLVLQHGKFVDPLAQMQVGEMDQFHGCAPPNRYGLSPLYPEITGGAIVPL